MIKFKQNLTKNNMLIKTFETDGVVNDQSKPTNDLSLSNYLFRVLNFLAIEDGCDKIYSFDNLTDEFLCAQKFLVKESTFSHYNNIINTHIRPYFRSFSLEEIDIEVIINFINEKLSSGRVDGAGGLSNKRFQ